MHNALLTFSKLIDIKLISSATCTRCLRGGEDILHALRDCEVSQRVWINLLGNLSYDSFFYLSLHDWLLMNIARDDSLFGVPLNIIFFHAAWLLWYWRNCRLHDSQFSWPMNATSQILGRAKEAWNVMGIYAKRLKYEMLIG
ncbi:hypothetical protein REPUB_Repub04eG0039900 [Reevesia pubescens]